MILNLRHPPLILVPVGAGWCKDSPLYLWGKMWGRISKSVGKENPRLGEPAMPLTIKEIENAKPREKKYKLADSGGLCLVVQPWGGSFGFGGIGSMAPKRT